MLRDDVSAGSTIVRVATERSCAREATPTGFLMRLGLVPLVPTWFQPPAAGRWVPSHWWEPTSGDRAVGVGGRLRATNAKRRAPSSLGREHGASRFRRAAT